MAPLVLAPSADQDVLRTAIEQASSSGAPLRLLPGTHLIRPGRGRSHWITIGENGLDLSSAFSNGGLATIKRPDQSIDLARPDDNYGLYFVPEKPSDEVLAAVQWRTDTDGTEYAVVIQGRVAISGVTVDCNMDFQGLEALPVDSAEHSAMLAFAGTRYKHEPSDVGTPRWVYVAFESVTLRDVTTVNGGYADDIWFARGYFNPNVALVDVCRLNSGHRVNGRRATVSFSGVCQQVRIHHADIYKLEMEDTQSTTYDQRPRPTDTFTPSTWDLTDIRTDRIDLAAKGKVYRVDARRLETNEAFYLYQAGGVIRDSTLRVGDERRLIRLDTFTFKDVTWILEPDAAGRVDGLKPTPQYGDPCEVTFLCNRFVVEGHPTSGEILTSEYSRKVDDNRVRVTAVGCHFPAGFGTDGALVIARVRERGCWTFAEADLDGRDPTVALPKGPQTDVELVLI